MDNDNNNDYGNEDGGYDPNAQNNDGGNPEDGNGNDPDVDQYFDDAGDVGYLPADHVSYSFSHFRWLFS
jgi:hypothetical protein